MNHYPELDEAMEKIRAAKEKHREAKAAADNDDPGMAATAQAAVDQFEEKILALRDLLDAEEGGRRHRRRTHSRRRHARRHQTRKHM